MTFIEETKVLWRADGTADAVIRFTERMEVLGSAPLNGGHTVADTIFIMQVPHDFDCDDFTGALGRKRDELGLPAD